MAVVKNMADVLTRITHNSINNTDSKHTPFYINKIKNTINKKLIINLIQTKQHQKDDDKLCPSYTGSITSMTQQNIHH